MAIPPLPICGRCAESAGNVGDAGVGTRGLAIWVYCICCLRVDRFDLLELTRMWLGGVREWGSAWLGQLVGRVGGEMATGRRNGFAPLVSMKNNRKGTRVVVPL